MLFQQEIKNLCIFAYHGVYDHEKKNGQEFLVSLQLTINIDDETVANDNYDHSFCYSIIHASLLEEFTKTTYNLLETVAFKCIKSLFDQFSVVKAITITINKKKPPITTPCEHLHVQLTLDRQQLSQITEPCKKQSSLILGLGSNLGNRLENILLALKEIEALPVKVEAVSNVYETKPWQYHEQNNFFNAAVKISTSLNHKEILVAIKNIEKKLERTKTFTNGPRVIDIDILIYDDVTKIVEEDDLIIPHKSLSKRLFALITMQDVAPDILIKNKPITFHIDKLKQTNITEGSVVEIVGNLKNPSDTENAKLAPNNNKQC